MFSFGVRSLELLRGVHPDLVMVMKTAIERSPVDFSIVEGLRTVERQKKLFEAGASQTMKSRHITGHAVDIAPYVAGELRWDWALYNRIAPVIKQAANELGIPIEWGGDWKGGFIDGPHWQLPWKKYPV